MKNKQTLIAIVFISILLPIVVLIGAQQSVATLSKYGSRGEEVRQIQTKLKGWGYTLTVDGIYGTRTQNAVKHFQKYNGLRVDGIAGPQTLAKMGLYSNNATASNQNDINMLARIINAEARGEPHEGQVAVGAVVLNRVKHPSFPNSISAVIYQPGAFTAITDGQWQSNIEPSAYRAAQDAMNGWDPTHGCIYYYNPAKTTNKWIYSRPVMLSIGKHKFAK